MYTVRFQRVKARRLVTISPKDSIWVESYVGDTLRLLSGAIVRAFPPADAGDERIEAVKLELEAAGAARVRIEPRATGTKTVAPETAPPEVRQAPRVVVMQMADEARTRDREALVGVLDAALTTQKL